MLNAQRRPHCLPRLASEVRRRLIRKRMYGQLRPSPSNRSNRIPPLHGNALGSPRSRKPGPLQRVRLRQAEPTELSRRPRPRSLVRRCFNSQTLMGFRDIFRVGGA